MDDEGGRVGWLGAGEGEVWTIQSKAEPCEGKLV